jgi:hypothetical protein
VPEDLCGTSHINEPAWTEPLRMIADDIGASAAPLTAPDAKALRAGALLIHMALRTNPIWAAELSYLCGASVWKEVGSLLAKVLRAIYSVRDEHSRQLAVAGMLASGSDEFKDIVLPLFTRANQQVRLETSDFHVSSIGGDWQKIVSGRREEARAEFVWELLHFGEHRPEAIASFALADASIKVRTTAISALTWGGSSKEVTRLLTSLDEPTFRAALRWRHRQRTLAN